MKTVPKNPLKLFLFLLCIGVFGIYLGGNNLYLNVVEPASGRGSQVFEWLNAVFGTAHSKDYFFVFFGLYAIYYAVFKIDLKSRRK
jgi:hypothetical protein